MAKGVWLEAALNGPWTRQPRATVPIGARPSQRSAEARARYEVVERLGRADLVERSVVDPGTVSLATSAELRDNEDGFRYANSTWLVAEACHTVQQAGRPLATASEVRRATVGSDPLPSARTRR
jgi:hypothetical protein